jgi:hypothetical protein
MHKSLAPTLGDLRLTLLERRLGADRSHLHGRPHPEKRGRK